MASESHLWKHVPYIRPSRRYDPVIRQLMEDAVSVHKRMAALGLRHCLGCGCFLPRKVFAARCQPCTKRYRDGWSAHWWAGLRGREKRGSRPEG